MSGRKDGLGTSWKVLIIFGMLMNIGMLLHPVSALTFGDSTTISGTDTTIEDYMKAIYASPGSSGVADSISVYLNCTTTAKKARCALYAYTGADNAGALLGQTEEKTIPVNGHAFAWYIFNFTGTKPYIVAGTNYYLCVWGYSTTGSFYIKYASSGQNWIYTNTVYGSPSNAWMNPWAGEIAQARTYGIYVNYHVNIAPNITNPSPANGSTGVSLMPSCAVTVNDSNADKMTLFWYENSTGSWVLRQTNSSCSNGTYRWDFINATSDGHIYWWKVACNDGFSNSSAVYYFTTEVSSLPPNITSPSPSDGAVNVSFPVTTCVDINYSFGDISDERYEWYNPGPMSASFFGKTFWNAQNFTVGAVGTNEDFVVTNITLELVRVTGKNLGDVVVSIRSNISGEDLCNGTIDGDLLIDDSTPPMLERINITMSPGVVLSANTNYFIITRAPDAEDTSSGAWYYLFSTGAYPGGWFYTSNNAGASWSGDTYNTSDHWFNVWGITETDCLHYEFWTNESGAWVEYGNGSACGNGTYCASNNFDAEYTKYWWSINVSYPGGWVNETFSFTTSVTTTMITLSNEDPLDGSTVVYTYPGYLGLTHFNMSITRSHSRGYDMNTSVWFNGTFLFTNTTWGNGTITFDLFDYWSGHLVDSGVYNWSVNASGDSFPSGVVYDNETYNFIFEVNVSGAVSGGLLILRGDPWKYLVMGFILGSVTGIVMLLNRRKKK
jgi:hypothetical protein